MNSTASQKIIPYLIGGAAFIGLYSISRYNYLLFHTLTELFSIVVAAGIFFVTWNTRRFIENKYLLFIGIAYIFIAFLDIIHTLSYKDIAIFEGFDANLPTQLWIGARYMESISLLLAPLFINRRLNIQLVITCYCAITVLLLTSIFHWQNFPICFVEGVGLTQFKVISEYLISLLLIVAIILLFQRRTAFENKIFLLLLFSIIATIGAELAFSFYISVYDISNLAGHYLKIISFFLIYKAIIETALKNPFQLLFKELKQSEIRFRNLVETTTDWVWEIDADGQFTYVNNKILDMLGYSVDEILGKSPSDFVPPEEIVRRLDLIKSVLKSRQPFTAVEGSFVHKDGKLLTFETSGVPIVKSDGTLHGYRGISRDITDRKKAEEALSTSESRFRELFDNMSSGVAVYKRDKEGRFIFSDFNRAAEKLSQIRKKDLIGKPVDLMFPGIHELGLLDVFQKTWETGSPQHHPVSIYKDERIELWVESYVFKLPSGEVVGVYDDVTERMRAEKLLQESEKKYRTLVDNSLVGIFKTTVKGDLVFANTAAIALLGYKSIEEADSHGIWNVYKNRQDRENLISLLREQSTVNNYDVELLDKSGQIKNILLRATLEGEEISGMILDITERIQAEEEIKKYSEDIDRANDYIVDLYRRIEEINSELSEQNRNKTNFLRLIGHEIKTPINSIITLSNLLTKKIDGDLTPEQAKQVDMIHESAEYLTNLVNDLQDLSRIEAGVVQVKTTDFTLEELYEQATANIKPLAMEKGLSLHLAQPENIPELKTDFKLTLQVLLNLLSNAVKFTDQGEIRVNTRVTPEEINEEIVINVHDTGIGIAPDKIDEIFNEFIQAHARSDSESGTGLGLTIAKSLARKLGGDITVKSKLGEGSTFSFTFPGILPHEKSATDQMPSGEKQIDFNRQLPMAKITETEKIWQILIIDDDEAQILTLQKYIKKLKLSCCVHTANNGQEGLQILMREKPDLIILDLIMPVMNGFEFLEKLYEEKIYSNIPIIIHSSKELGAEEELALEKKATVVIRKGSLPIEEILKTLQNILTMNG